MAAPSASLVSLETMAPLVFRVMAASVAVSAAIGSPWVS